MDRIRPRAMDRVRPSAMGGLGPGKSLVKAQGNGWLV